MNIDPNWEVSVSDVDAMRKRGDAFLLLDVRQPEEFAICKIDGAQLIPLHDLESRVDDVKRLAAGKPVVTQCHHGGRSLSAAAILRKAGLADVKSMAGGIDLWSLQIDAKVPRY